MAAQSSEENVIYERFGEGHKFYDVFLDNPQREFELLDPEDLARRLHKEYRIFSYPFKKLLVDAEKTKKIRKVEDRKDTYVVAKYTIILLDHKKNKLVFLTPYEARDMELFH
jgi:hypothetical protein